VDLLELALEDVVLDIPWTTSRMRAEARPEAATVFIVLIAATAGAEVAADAQRRGGT